MAKGERKLKRINNNMTFGFDYHLYNSSYHKQKSAIYSYKANTYLNDCGHNILQIAMDPRLAGLGICALLVGTVAIFIPVSYIPIVSYLASHTLALISRDPALIFIGAIFTSGSSYSLLDKAIILGITLMLLDEGQHGLKIAKCVVDNIKNIAVYAGYQFLSWGEYFKSFFSDFFKINKENDETLDKIPQEKVITSKDLAESISLHQQYINLYSKNLSSVMSTSSKAIALEGGKLLGITLIMNSVLSLGGLMQPMIIDKSQINYIQTYVVDRAVHKCDDWVAKNGIIGGVMPSSLSNTIKIAGLLASVSPFCSSDYVQKYCNGDVFSIKSANYHLAQYASKETYNKFIEELGTGVILSLKYGVLITYHYMALCKEELQQSYAQSKAKIVLEDNKIQKELVEEPTASESDILPAVEIENHSGIELFAELPEVIECGG